MKESTSALDAEKYKEVLQNQWNETSAAWQRWTSTIQDWFMRLTGLMFELAQIEPGQRVLDVAAGSGGTAISAAAYTGIHGYVLATDLAENMLAFARQAAVENGLHNLDTRMMDAENLDLPDADFHRVICRFGLMLIPDKLRALSEMRRVLKPGGRCVVSVFTTPDRNDWAVVPISIIRRRAQLPPPPPGQPGLFSLGGDGQLEQAFLQAGFTQIETYPITIPLRLPSAREANQLSREAFGALNQMMLHLSQEERDSVWHEVEEAMRIYEGPNGFEAPCEAMVGLGVK